MIPITIPKKLIKNGDLVIIPRQEYEEYLKFRSQKNSEIELTPAQKRALKEARTNLSQGKYLTFHELKQKLGVKN